MERKELLKRLEDYVTITPIDYSTFSDEELEFRLKILESIFETEFEN